MKQSHPAPSPQTPAAKRLPRSATKDENTKPHTICVAEPPNASRMGHHTAQMPYKAYPAPSTQTPMAKRTPRSPTKAGTTKPHTICDAELPNASRMDQHTALIPYHAPDHRPGGANTGADVHDDHSLRTDPSTDVTTARNSPERAASHDNQAPLSMWTNTHRAYAAGRPKQHPTAKIPTQCNPTPTRTPRQKHGLESREPGFSTTPTQRQQLRPPTHGL